MIMYKNYFLSIFICCLLFKISYSQEITGIASYKSFAKFDLKLDSTKVNSEMQKQITQLVNQQTQKEYELRFNNFESVFKEKEILETPGYSLFPGATVTISGGFGALYENLKENRTTDQKDLYGKLFLVKDTLKKQDWKLEKETKNIGEYTCFKATRTRISENASTGEKKEIPIVAWYTPQIPIAFGPLGFGGLPGLILEITDGDLSYLCNQIILNPKNGVDVAEPSKGKKVSREEYEKIETKKTKEIQERSDFPGNKSIEIRVGG